jgi:hypothetical protein
MSKQTIITMIEFGRDGLITAAQAVPEDKLDWKPLDNGRTVLDLLGECAQTPDFLLQLLREGKINASLEGFAQMAQERAGWTREYSLQRLREKTAEALNAIREIPEEKFDDPLQLPLYNNATLPFGVWVLMLYRTFAARTAQINYIQTLYGDFDFH